MTGWINISGGGSVRLTAVRVGILMPAVPAAVLGFTLACSIAHAAGPPLPNSRPVVIDLAPVTDQDQPSDEEQLPEEDQVGTEQPEKPVLEKQAEQKLPEPRPVLPAPVAPEPPAPVRQAKPAFDLAKAKQCERELRKLNAKFTVTGPITGDGQCGWPRAVKLTSLARNVKIKGDIRVRCELALALARWSKEVMVPSAKLHLGKAPKAVRIDTSYQCRRRNNAKTGKLSEHAFANGVDVMGFVFPDDQIFNVAVRSGSANAERAFQAAVRGGSCAYFTTVLGPMTNASHADHFHFDLAVRRGGYRLCQ